MAMLPPKMPLDDVKEHFLSLRMMPLTNPYAEITKLEYVQKLEKYVTRPGGNAK